MRSTVEYGRARVEVPGPHEVPLLLDLYRPDDAGSCPVAVLVHGGGFFEGSRSDVGMVRIGEELCSRGVAAVSIDYRLRDQLPVASARVEVLARQLGDRIPAAVTAADDLLSSLDWIAGRTADGMFDASGVVLVGSSAGAATVNHVAYAMNGSSPVPIRGVASVWGGSLVPISGATTAVPPLITMHGSSDTVVPPKASEDLVAKVIELGGTAEHHVLDGGGHGHENSGIWEHEIRPGVVAIDHLVEWIVGRFTDDRES